MLRHLHPGPGWVASLHRQFLCSTFYFPSVLLSVPEPSCVAACHQSFGKLCLHQALLSTKALVIRKLCDRPSISICNSTSSDPGALDWVAHLSGH